MIPSLAKCDVTCVWLRPASQASAHQFDHRGIAILGYPNEVLSEFFLLVVYATRLR